jgi:hypothetical protein
MGTTEQPGTTETRTGSGFTREDIRGRAVGIVVMAFFGLAWISWGLSADLPAAVGTALTVASVLATVLAIGGAGYLFRRSAAVPAGGAAGRDRAAGRRFGLIVTAEFVGIYVIARILAALDHTELIPLVVCLGVGIHFFPLTRLFKVPLYDLTGAGLCLVTVGTAVIAPLTGHPALWTVLPGLGAALVLYATATVLFRAAIGAAPGRRAAVPPRDLGRLDDDDVVVLQALRQGRRQRRGPDAVAVRADDGGPGGPQRRHQPGQSGVGRDHPDRARGDRRPSRHVPDPCPTSSPTPSRCGSAGSGPTWNGSIISPSSCSRM